MNKSLSVRLHGKPIGILEQDKVGKMIFTYFPDAAQPLSLSLPLNNGSFTDEACRAYFGGLLPEGDTARKAIGNKYGINPKNDFSLLKAIGYDCAGAVSFHSYKDPVEKIGFLPLEGRPFNDKELAAYILDLPRKPLFIGVDGMRLSLAGVQDKAAICLIDDKVCIPLDNSPTTHILKPAIEGIKDSIENEYLCLRVPKQLDINVPNVEIRHANGIPYLLVERYDRQIKPNGTIKRIHQEDFCQALGVITAYKYQSEGGPSIKDCFELLLRVTYPAKDRNQLANRIIFNFLIGNTDAHAKNFSLLHQDNNLIQLAPAYDLLSARIYPDLTDKMAMKIGGEYDISKILLRHWEKLCQESSYSYPALRKTIKYQVENLVSITETEINTLKSNGFNTNIGQKILSYLDKSCTKIQKQLDI